MSQRSRYLEKEHPQQAEANPDRSPQSVQGADPNQADSGPSSATRMAPAGVGSRDPATAVNRDSASGLVSGNSWFFRVRERLPLWASVKSQDSTIHSHPKHSLMMEGRRPVRRFIWLLKANPSG